MVRSPRTRLEQTTTGLLALSRGTVSDRTELPLGIIANDARARWMRDYVGAARSLQVDVDDAIGFASKTAVNQILDVLLENSLEHGRGVTRIVVRPINHRESSISVRDDGAVDPLADPFASARGVGHGIGLKLARSLAETERCALRLVNRRPAVFGLCLTTTDPAADVAAAAAADVLVDTPSGRNSVARDVTMVRPMATPFPSQPDQVTASWLTTILNDSGALASGRAVTGCSYGNVGEIEGLLGIVARFVLTYDGVDDHAPGPETLVVKFATAVEANRAIGMNTRMYEREVRFLNDVAPSVNVPMPICHFADVDPSNGDVVVVLEDLRDYKAGDQVDGVDAVGIKRIIDAIAPLHAAYWGKTDQPILANAMRVDTNYIEPFMPGVEAMWENGVRLFSHVMAPDVVPECGRFVGRLREVFRWNGRCTQTLVHGDVRLDNVMWGYGADQHPVMLIDWQNVMVSNPLQDLAYLMGQSVEVDVRRKHENEVVEYYHAKLVEQGVTDFSLDECWKAYDLAMLFLFAYPLIIGGFCDMDNPRGVLLAEAVLRRSSTAVSDRGLLRMLD
jgi:Ecdysteroid kinase-like family